MRIPILAASFAHPIFLEGMSRNRVVAGTSVECAASRMEFDPKTGMVYLWPKRPRGVRSVDGKNNAAVGAMIAFPSCVEVLEEFTDLLEEVKTVKPGVK